MKLNANVTKAAPEDVGLPQLAGIPLELLQQVVYHVLRLLFVAHDGGNRRLDIRPVFPYLSDDICPMFFPFFVENRDALIKHLADRHIPPKVYWPVPPFVKVEDYPGAQYIYSHIMSVSCDERFNTDDMQKIVEAFENY